MDFSASLFTDSALTATVGHNGHLKPYTTATTMNAGWCWNIPLPEADHIGYVQDELRWFLSIHYKFNTRLDTPFWNHVWRDTDVSGLQPLLDVFAAGAPLQRRDSLVRLMLRNVAPPVYGVAGVDNILLGQQVPAAFLRSAEPQEQWQARLRGARAVVGLALPQHEALAEVHACPAILDGQLTVPGSWLRGPSAARGAVRR